MRWTSCNRANSDSDSLSFFLSEMLTRMAPNMVKTFKLEKNIGMNEEEVGASAYIADICDCVTQREFLFVICEPFVRLDTSGVFRIYFFKSALDVIVVCCILLSFWFACAINGFDLFS